MRIKRMFLLLLLSLAFIVAKSLCASPPEELRIMSYNIFNGFEHGDSLQTDNFLKFVEAQDPDILALQELVDINAADLVKLAARYGHLYSATAKEKGYPVGITSKFPIEMIHRQVDGYWHGMMHVRIADLDIIVTHLSPFEWKFRLKEAAQILNYIDANSLADCVIMGDLNAHSPLDGDVLENHTDLKEQIRKWDIENPQYGNLRNGNYDYSVISTFMAKGFEDVIGRLVHPSLDRVTFPAAFLYGWEWNDARLRQKTERLDYILVSENLFPNCISAQVHNGRDAEGISDHYPVSVVMKTKK